MPLKNNETEFTLFKFLLYSPFVEADRILTVFKTEIKIYIYRFAYICVFASIHRLSINSILENVFKCF